jgi:hypothetical protein
MLKASLSSMIYSQNSVEGRAMSWKLEGRAMRWKLEERLAKLLQAACRILHSQLLRIFACWVRVMGRGTV